ncbi:hypothetical protein MA20_48625 [Bradyrhizobium japonicum]|uniref:Uncharacterized protein n=1 Tax=Bradyrhizobium japonicum TaxID=375 RepID=A0A0A3XE56_BRAJP|nr:hypothetical protein MA20_48625 [Bradyrhizobium japonicum]
MVTGTVRHRSAGLVVALDRTSKTFPFGHARYVYDVSCGENISFQLLTNLKLTEVYSANFANEALRCSVCFRCMAFFRLVSALFFFVTEADLDRFVTVVCLIFLLKNNAWTSFDNCNSDRCTVWTENLSHAQFFT